jgi:Tfp pilus assembly protein PilV
MNTDERQAPSCGNDEGIGLIEIVVSMFLLALIAITFLPILIQGMQTSVLNAGTATAGQLVSQQLDEVRSIPSDCAAVSAFDDVAAPTATDARGTVFHPHREVGTCPSTYPGLVAVRVWVTKGSATVAVSEAKTLVYLSSATAPTPTPTPTP